jgi:hypothetical protein
VQLFVGGRARLTEQVTVEWLDESDRLYGVVSSNPSDLNFLNDVIPSGGGAAVAHVDLEALSLDPLEWEGLDVLILNDVDTASLGSQHRQALETWLAHGGHLIVGGGAGAARTVAGVADLLPVAVGGTRSVDSLWALGVQMRVSVNTGPYAVAEAMLQDGEVLIEQDGLILLARHTYGAGQVDFLAFDAGLNPFVQWSDSTRFWEGIVGLRTVGARGLGVRSGYSARDAVNAIPGLEIPSTLQILAFMLVYTLLIGPVNYLVLRKLDRRELAWLTIPLLVCSFTGCAYLTGFQVRGALAIVHRIGVVYVPAGADVGRVSQVMGLFSPRRTNYDVWVEGASVGQIPEGDYYGGPAGQALYVVEEADGVTVSDLRVDIGGIEPFVAEGYADVPTVESALQLVADNLGALQLEGTVRNSGITLEDAVLLMGRNGQRLGDVGAGQEIHVSYAFPTTLSYYTYDDVPDQVMGSGSYYNDPKLYRRYELLRSLFPYGEPSQLEGGVYLVGWAEDSAPLPVEIVGRSFSAIGTTFYVYELPVTDRATAGRITIGPDLITRQVEKTTGYVDAWSECCYLDPGAEIEFRFTVFPGVSVGQVDQLIVDMQGYTDSTMRIPAVALWNWETEEWDEFDFGWGEHSVANAENYVLSPGDVLLRLTAEAEWSSRVENLAITIKGQR